MTTATAFAIDVPTQIIWGDHDRIVPTAFASKLHEDIRGSELHVLKGCGHIPQEEKPEETASLIRSFVGRALATNDHLKPTKD